MRLLVPDAIGRDPGQRDAIREVCEKDLAEPAHIWEDLEAKGINVTPGVIYQALGSLQKQPQKAPSHGTLENPPPHGAVGLTVEDLETVASLVQKAGGVEQFVRCLGLLYQAPPSPD